MSAGFTPGPWAASVERRPYPASGCWYVVLDGERNGLGEFYGDDHEANTANLRLAAAAPELYEALNTAIETLREHCPDFAGSSYVAAVESAHDALAKARGDQ